MTDIQTFEDALIEDMRTHAGRVTAGPLAGHPLLVLRSRGAKSGAERRAILTWHRDGDSYVVAGTADGSPTTPAWVRNVQEHPEVSLEAESRTFDATATVVTEGPERDRLWQDHVEQLPWFADYPQKSGRLIPMVLLTPTTA